MGRANYVLLGMGLAAMVALSLMMSYIVEESEGRAENPLHRELMANFCDRVEGEILCELTPCPGGRRATVTLRPEAGQPVKRLARDIGQFVWRQSYSDHELTEVHVVFRTGSARPDLFDVPSPYSLAQQSVGAGR